LLCNSCGQENREGRRFCAQCGGSLASACPSCGAANEAGERFCGECGKTLSTVVSSQVPTSTPAPSPALPASFADGRYLVKGFLGEGGRKKVYLAHDEKLDRDVAVAVIKTEGLDDAGLARVKREAQAMGRLGDHPNIVTVFDIGDDGGQPYIVSQYMGGGDLDGLLNRAPDRRLSIPEAMRIATQVQQGLAHAHERGIIHRDLKPGNIWLTEDGTAKIGDFGLAVSLDRSRLTMEGMMVGTVAYMAPEQALGRQPDARSDLYSLGCVTYEMVTGRAPFLGDDPVAIISQHINTAPVAPSWHNPQVPRALESLILRLLAKDPSERPDNASAIPEALQAIVATASTTTPVAAESDVNPLDRLATGIFVGREKEMDELRAGLEDSLSGRGRLMMLVGEPGIGKTRTSEEFATYARLRNVQVLWGRCYEGEGAPAYWPWVQIIRAYVHDKEPKDLASEMGPGAADIAQVVSEVKERLPGLPAPPQLEPDQARFRLFDSITTFLKNASKGAPLMVVLDDMHWADKPSLLLLQFLAKELRGSRLLVLGTYRDVELRRQHPLAQTLGELNRENLSQRVLLRGLTEHDVRRFVEVTAGTTPSEALVQAVYRETEGNPFFVNEIVRLLVADGRLEKAEGVKDWSVTIPQSVREVVGRRLDHLSEECNKVLTVGAVIGREFGIKLLEKVAEVKGDRLLEALEEAMAARVIAELPKATDQYWFSHALIRETLYEELSTTRRVRLHRQIGEALEELDAEGNLSQLAYHFCEAAPGGDAEKAVDYARRAGDRAMSLYAYEDAASHYERALQALEVAAQPNEIERCGLLVTLGGAEARAGESDTARAIYLRAAELARNLKSAELLGEAALGLVRVVNIAVFDEPCAALLKEALAALADEDSALRARLLGALAMLTYFISTPEQRLAATQEALEMARRVGDESALVLALNARHQALFELDYIELRLEVAPEQLHLAEKAGLKDAVFSAHLWLLVDHLEAGNIPAMYAEIEQLSRLAEELRQPSHLWNAALVRAAQAIREGRFEDGEKMAQQALAVGQRSEAQNAMQMYAIQVFALRREQGRAQELEPALRGFVEQYPLVPAWRTGLAYLYSELEREAEAREQFEFMAADNFAALPNDVNWSAGAALLTEACAFLGDAERAAVLYDRMLPHATRWINVGVAADTLGCFSRPLGLLATTLGRWADAERHFQYALDVHARMGVPTWLAWTHYSYAEMLHRRHGEGDREKAMQQVNSALDIAQKLGMKALVERALALKIEVQGVSFSDIGTSIDTVAREALAEQPDLKKHAAPDGTVTIMFSDIEGSTAMADRLGDKRFMDVLREHNAIIRKQVKAHGGFEVKSEGDGFMVAFQSAGKALACASAIQKALAERNDRVGASLGDGSGEGGAAPGAGAGAGEKVMVRMGLHAGEVIKEGEDFFGRNVIMAARVASQAQGGEILASAVLKALLSGSDVAWGGSRTVALKGLSGEHEIWAVEWAS
jgi:class 3 adenylate cyclase/sugar phosphate isomerase/epimerase